MRRSQIALTVLLILVGGCKKSETAQVKADDEASAAAPDCAAYQASLKETAEQVAAQAKELAEKSGLSQSHDDQDIALAQVEEGGAATAFGEASSAELQNSLAQKPCDELMASLNIATKSADGVLALADDLVIEPSLKRLKVKVTEKGRAALSRKPDTATHSYFDLDLFSWWHVGTVPTPNDSRIFVWKYLRSDPPPPQSGVSFPVTVEFNDRTRKDFVAHAIDLKFYDPSTGLTYRHSFMYYNYNNRPVGQVTLSILRLYKDVLEYSIGDAERVSAGIASDVPKQLKSRWTDRPGTDYCLDQHTDTSKLNDGYVYAHPCTGQKNQKFYNPQDVTIVASALDYTCLDVHTSEKQGNGYRVYLNPDCHRQSNQLFRRDADGTIHDYWKNFCLDVDYGTPVGGGYRVYAYPCHGKNNQQWDWN